MQILVENGNGHPSRSDRISAAPPDSVLGTFLQIYVTLIYVTNQSYLQVRSLVVFDPEKESLGVWY